MKIVAGTEVLAEDADGERLRRVAATGVVAGLDFPVVWLCEPDEFARADAEGRKPDAVPWPAEAVSPSAIAGVRSGRK